MPLRPFSRHLLLTLHSLCAGLLCAGASAAQSGLVPIGDLTRTPPPLADEGISITPIQCRLDAFRSWHALGQSQLLESGAAPYSPEMLRQLVIDLTGIDKEELERVEGFLRVSPEDEGAVRLAVAQLRQLARQELIELEMRLEQRTAKGWKLLSAGHGRCRSGQLCSVDDLRIHTKVTDYNVEIAHQSAVGDPKVIQVADGAQLLARARSVPGSEYAIVELIAGVREDTQGEKIAIDYEQLGDLDRVVADESRCAMSFLIERNKLSQHEWSDRHGRTLRLSVHGAWQPSAVHAEEQLLASSLLATRIVDLGWCPANDPRAEAERKASFSSGTRGLLSLLSQKGLTDYWQQGESALRVARFDKPDEQPISLVQELLRAVQRSYRLEFDVYVCDVGKQVPADADESGGVARVARIRTSLLSGLGASFLGLHSRSYLKDYNVEVAQSARIADPIVASISAGYWLGVTGTLDADRPHATLEFHLRLQDCTWAAPRRVRMGSAVVTPGLVSPEKQMIRPGSRDGRVPETRMTIPEKRIWSTLQPEEGGNVEVPTLARKDLRLDVGVELGKERVLRFAAPTILPDGKELVIRIRAQ